MKVKIFEESASNEAQKKGGIEQEMNGWFEENKDIKIAYILQTGRTGTETSINIKTLLIVSVFYEMK